MKKSGDGQCLRRHFHGPINAKTGNIYNLILNAVQITKSRCISGQTISYGHKVVISLFSQVIVHIFCLSDVVGLSSHDNAPRLQSPSNLAFQELDMFLR